MIWSRRSIGACSVDARDQRIERQSNVVSVRSSGWPTGDARRTREQGVQLAFACRAFLPHALELQLEDAELRLRLDDVLLRRLADCVAVLADLQQRVEQVAIARQDVANGVRVGKAVVRLLHACRDAQPRGLDLLRSASASRVAMDAFRSSLPG